MSCDYHLVFCHQVVKNAKKLCSGLQAAGYKIATDGTDVHLLLVDLRNIGLSGAKAELVLEEMHIACNKNTGTVSIAKIVLLQCEVCKLKGLTDI